jgi:hypothetical protein
MNDRAMKLLPALLPAALLLPALLLPGCVERKFLIRSDPPGATVTLNHGEPLPEVTPTEVEFHHYGVWAVRAEREGCRDLDTNVSVPTPWWSYPVLDFVTDVLWPFTIRDHREIALVLEPLPEPRTVEEVRERHAEVIGRGEDLREKVNEGDPSEVR